MTRCSSKKFCNICDKKHHELLHVNHKINLKRFEKKKETAFVKHASKVAQYLSDTEEEEDPDKITTTAEFHNEND